MLTTSNFTSLPHIRHGFFCSDYNVGQRTLKEKYNFKAIQNILGGQSIVHLNQTHSSLVSHADKDLGSIRMMGDALITQTTGVVLCVRSADCAPILIAHKTKPIIAAIHAGWRGAILTRIIENTVQELAQLDTLDNYIAVVGPCLQQKNFQTGSLIYNNVADKSYFDAKRYFDFSRFVGDKLAALGGVEVLKIDTYDSDNFYSARKLAHNKITDVRRQASAIVLI